MKKPKAKGPGSAEEEDAPIAALTKKIQHGDSVQPGAEISTTQTNDGLP